MAEWPEAISRRGVLTSTVGLLRYVWQYHHCSCSGMHAATTKGGQAAIPSTQSSFRCGSLAQNPALMPNLRSEKAQPAVFEMVWAID
jgi:hypothetical protein